MKTRTTQTHQTTTEEMIFKIFLTKTGQREDFIGFDIGFLFYDNVSLSLSLGIFLPFPRLPIKLILRSIAPRNALSFVF